MFFLFFLGGGGGGGGGGLQWATDSHAESSTLSLSRRLLGIGDDRHVRADRQTDRQTDRQKGFSFLVVLTSLLRTHGQKDVLKHVHRSLFIPPKHREKGRERGGEREGEGKGERRKKERKTEIRESERKGSERER